jgi:3-oxoacyl-[acyl-carrier protein] reductase
MDQRFAGRVVLVTGGGRGLGVEIAKAFAARGADIAISYSVSEQKAKAFVAELRTLGVRAVAFRADQGDKVQALNLAAQVVAELGRLDILVNNAAVASYGLITDPSADEAIDKAWAINVTGLVATTRGAARVMSDNGRIIFIGSGMGKYTAMMAASDNSGMKGMMDSYARGVARDLASKGITANVVHAGLMRTDMASAYPRDIDLVAATFAMGRFAELEEVTSAVLFYADPINVMVTGTALDVDGGRMA